MIKMDSFPSAKNARTRSTENGWTFIPGQVDQVPTSSHHVDGSMAEHPSKTILTIPQKFSEFSENCRYPQIHYKIHQVFVTKSVPI
jgi:hypothetical protein